MPIPYESVRLGDRLAISGTTVDGVQLAAKGYVTVISWDVVGPMNYPTRLLTYDYPTNRITVEMGDSFRATFDAERLTFWQWEDRPDIPEPVEHRKEIEL